MDRSATRLGDDPNGFNAEERRLVDQVAEHGWRTTGVAAPPGYAAYGYTTGFWLTFGVPEIVVFDLTAELRHNLFGLIARDIAGGRDFASGVPVDRLIEGDRMWFMPVGRAQADAYLPGSKWFYRDAAFPCWQMVWGDGAGRFPWDDGFEAGLAGVQPDLSANSDWGASG